MVQVEVMFRNLLFVGKPLVPGDSTPPDISVLDENGTKQDIGALLKKGLTLIYFFPKADTPGCTAQSCSLRDDFSTLKQKGVRIFGSSTDTPGEQKKFQEKYQLPFPLLADTEGSLARAFGVPILLGMVKRQAFLIRDGKVIWSDPAASTRKQAQDVLHFLNNESQAGS